LSRHPEFRRLLKDIDAKVMAEPRKTGAEPNPAAK
jgi:hypothetical protein